MVELLYEDGPHYFTARMYEALERFAEVMRLRGVEFHTIDNLIFYAIHLALTFIHIKDLKNELKIFKKEIETAKINEKVIHE